MPSGRDPGLEVSLFGVPVQHGQGKDPTRLELFNLLPKVEMVEIPNPGGGADLTLPMINVGIVPLSLRADPVDLGANAQRLVHGKVLSVQAL
jgi:hypothetical protein